MLINSFASLHQGSAEIEKMFRLFFVLALAFLLSSFVTSQNKSANQVIKVITSNWLYLSQNLRGNRIAVFCFE